MTSHTFRNCSTIIDIDDSVQVLVAFIDDPMLVYVCRFQFLSWSSTQLLVRNDSANNRTHTNVNHFVPSNFYILGFYMAAVAAAGIFTSLEPSRWRYIDRPGHLQTAYTRQQVIIYEWLKLSLRMFQNPLSDIKVALCSLCSCRRRSLCITDTWTRFVE